MRAAPPRRRADIFAPAAVWTLILLYVALFGWQSVARHQALGSSAYDLGNVNQAFWNTVHGRPLYFTNWRGVELVLATDNRLAMHVEPIYFLLAPLYALWQQPETILILQTVVLVLGAWPVYWLARDRTGSRPSGVLFAAIYLLFPALEAANLWEFHAVALAAPLLLFTFYYGQAGRWRLMWLCAVLAMATKEEIPLTVALMGLYFAGWGAWHVMRQRPLAASRGGGLPPAGAGERVRDPALTAAPPSLRELELVPASALPAARPPEEVRQAASAEALPPGVRGEPGGPELLPPFRRSGLRRFWTAETANGLALILVAGLWFILAVQVIVPHFAGDQSPYLDYYGELGDSPGQLLRGLLTQPDLVASTLLAPRKLRYLFDLYTPVAFLSLLSPASIVFSGPDLLINLLSNQESMQFVEKYHYVAPVVPGVMISAILGTAWAVEWMRRALGPRLRAGHRFLALLLACLALAATGHYHYFHGYTPLARAWESYEPTPHDRLAEQIARAIPADASVSAQPNLNPHVSGRKTLYRFPYVGDAQYLFLDLSTLSSDGWIFSYLKRMLASNEFGPVAARDGYLLLKRGAPPAELPDESFYSFMRVGAASGRVAPQYPADVQFGDMVRLTGFDFAAGRRTEMPQTPLRFTLYLQATGPRDGTYYVVLYLLDGDRQVIGSMNLEREPGPQYWYAVKQWRIGETIKLDLSNMPWWTAQYARYSVAMGILRNRDTWNQARRVRPVIPAGGLTLPLPADQTLVELLRFRTDPGGMPMIVERGPLAAPPPQITGQPATWQNGIRLHGYTLSAGTVRPGGQVAVTLYWQTDLPIATNYKVFAQIVGEGGLVTGYDAEPDQGAFPTSLWPAGVVFPDRHPLQVPSDVRPGKYSLIAGLYDPATGQRVPLSAGGDALTLSTPIEIR